MNKKIFLSILISLTIILPFVLFSIFPENARWSILIIPGILITVMFPKWRVIFPIVFSFSILRYIYVLTMEGFSYDILTDLIIGSIENYFIIFTIAYFIIRNAKLLKENQVLSLVDQLTGAYNRRFFDEYMEKVFDANNRPKPSIHLILLDIDHFKNINDSYGHNVGDEVLIKMVDVIKKNIRSTDELVRIGGEEFAILLPQIKMEECLLIAERIRRAIEGMTISNNGHQVNITISLGITYYRNNASVLELMEEADQALYEAKRKGRNQVVMFNP